MRAGLVAVVARRARSPTPPDSRWESERKSQRSTPVTMAERFGFVTGVGRLAPDSARLQTKTQGDPFANEPAGL